MRRTENEAPVRTPAARRDARTGRLRLPGVKLPPLARERLHDWVINVLRRDGPAPNHDTPIGDPGLFGPDMPQTTHFGMDQTINGGKQCQTSLFNPMETSLSKATS